MPFNIALSGLQAASGELQIVGNNVANASTTGFKRSRGDFADVYASSALGTGSTAIGTGVRLSSVSQQFTQGTVSFTDNNLDLAINGEGFFRLNDAGSIVYSRAGTFGVDNEGYVVNTSNQRLTGFLADDSGTITGEQGDLQISTANLTPKSTATMNASLNLDSSAEVPAATWVGTPTFGGTPPASNTYNDATATTIYDSLGNSHVLSTYYIKTATPNTWDVRFQIDGVDVDSAGATAPFTQVFNANGSFDASSSENITLSWNPLDENGNANGATSPQATVIDITNSTQFGSPFAVQAMTQDGFTTGRLNSLEVDAGGVVFGRYSNGQSRALGQAVLANFSNSQGLQPTGDTSWAETFSSGVALVGAPGTASLGLIQSGALEDSNVALTDELVQLIVAQRNFQANAQTIRTADAVTQTIINLR